MCNKITKLIKIRKNFQSSVELKRSGYVIDNKKKTNEDYYICLKYEYTNVIIYLVNNGVVQEHPAVSPHLDKTKTGNNRGK